jgi:hypothetical protein
MNDPGLPLAPMEQPCPPLAAGKPGRRYSVAVLGRPGRSASPETQWLSLTLAELLGHELAVAGQLVVLPGRASGRARAALDLAAPGPLTPAELHPLRLLLDTDLVVSVSCQRDEDVEGGGLQLAVHAQEGRTGGLVGYVRAFGPDAPYALAESAGAALRRQLQARGLSFPEAARRATPGSRGRRTSSARSGYTPCRSARRSPGARTQRGTR